jgi:hypothetical protein
VGTAFERDEWVVIPSAARDLLVVVAFAFFELAQMPCSSSETV